MARETGQVGGIDAEDVRVNEQLGQAAEGPGFALTGAGALVVGSGALSVGTRAARLTLAGMAQYQVYLETDTYLLYYYDGSKWLFDTAVGFGTNATRAALSISANDNGAVWFATDTGVLWRVEGGAWVNKFVRLEVTTEIKVAGNKVLGARGAAVADVASPDAVDLATTITLVNELKAQVNTAFARLRSTTGHGVWT